MKTSCRRERPVLIVGDVCEGFPNDVGEVVRDHGMCDSGSKCGAGFEGGVPVRIIMMKGALVVCRAAVMAFESG